MNGVLRDESRSRLSFAKENCLQREETNLVLPFFRIAGRPDEQQILNGETDVKILGDNDQPWTRAAVEEPRKVCRHGLAIVRNQNPPEIGRSMEDVGIWYTDNPRRVGIPENNARSQRRKPRTIFWLKSASA